MTRSAKIASSDPFQPDDLSLYGLLTQFPWKIAAVKGDYRTVADAVATNGSTTLTSATAGWVSSDVGKLIKIRGAGVSAADYATTISVFVSATQVTLALAPSTSVNPATIVWASDDAPAIQAAINSLRTDNLGLGYGSVFIPAGYYMLGSTIANDTQYAKLRLIGAGKQQTFLEHVGAASNGGIYITGPTLDIGGGILQPRNGNWFSIEQLAIGSLSDHGINIDSGANSRIADVWISCAGPSGKAYLRISRGFEHLYERIRLGGGDWGGGVGWFAPMSFISTYITGTNTPDYGIWASNSNTNLTGELHFYQCESHSSSKVNAFRAETLNLGAASMFDINVDTCRFKMNWTAFPTASAYYLDGGRFKLSNCYTESQGGIGPAITVKSTLVGGVSNVAIIGFDQDNATLVIDKSGAGSIFIRTDSSTFQQAIKTAGAGAHRWVHTNCEFAVDHADGVASMGELFIIGNAPSGTLYAFELATAASRLTTIVS